MELSLVCAGGVDCFPRCNLVPMTSPACCCGDLVVAILIGDGMGSFVFVFVFAGNTLSI